MRREDAERVVDSIQSAFDWVMESETHDKWMGAVARLADVEAADMSVVELYTGWTRQKGRHPMIGDVVEHYQAVRKRLEAERTEEERARLPAPDESRIPPELRTKIAQRGGGLVRAILREKGVVAPADEKHADVYDPPLSVPETRHDVHVGHGVYVPQCRFCRTDRESKEGATDEAV